MSLVNVDAPGLFRLNELPVVVDANVESVGDREHPVVADAIELVVIITVINRRCRVLTVLDIGEKPVPWAALELADGEFEPVEFVDVSTEQKLSLISQLCEAVHYDHRYGLAHRALSPSNVFVVDEGSSLWVADWEVSGRALGLASPEDDAYGVSEELRKLGVTQAADIYAIGMVAYALFSGERVPADPSDRRTLLDRVVGISPGLKSVLMSAVTMEGSEQFDTALHLRDADMRSA